MAYLKTMPQIATYDYTELASGLGYVVFDGFIMATSAGTTYGLSSNPPAASLDGDYTTYAATKITGVVGGTEYNLDASEFSIPRTIEGTAYINCFVTCDAGNTLYFTAQFYKVDSAAAETAIGSLIQSNTQAAGNSGTFLVPVEIPQTDFKTGEKLRLSIKVYGVNTSQYITVDPAARISNSIPFRVYMPFKLEV